jgi:hypothetical protein
MEDFTQMLDNKDTIDILYLDFQKAFDSVPHERLLLKIEKYGITGNIATWIRSFLTGRTQRVRVGKDYSTKKEVISGIPQGSILGPLLFTLYINDLPESVQSSCKIFADDTKLYGSPKNSCIMQNDITELKEWTETWQLYFNITKCKVLHIGKNNPQNDYYMTVDNVQVTVTKCDSEKNLGIIFDSMLTFDCHISEVINRASKILGIIQRCFLYLDKLSFVQLYKSLVRPHLEYGNIIWYPLLKRQSAAIDRIQRRATKMVPGLKDMSYIDRLEALCLPTLKARRVRGDLIQVYKILNNIDELDTNKFFELNKIGITRNSEYKFFIKQSRTNLRKHTFSNRVAPIWNKLPQKIKQANSLNSFKNLIDEHEIIMNIKYDFDK